ncbi:MAG TPA: AAA family ATPase [Burkholderiales bacterium]|nr:AAA family ATPase [Burkholderiales bacterium]
MASPAAALPPGVLSMHVLPADHHDKDWDAIIVPKQVKERLLSQALVTLKHGRKLSQLAGLPHGLIVLAGPPGTGKTTLARGLAQVAALALAREGATTLLEINPHAFPSDMLGESQRNIMRLLQDTIPEIAARRPHTVVLIDEVESFAVRRTSASFETNPVDVHRATDAVMLGIDEIARKLPSVLFVTTTNFIDAIDEAFLSRADLVMHFALPNAETIVSILQHSLEELAVQWPALQPLAKAKKEIGEIAALCDGWNGRQVRKLVLAAIAQRLEVAKDPALLTFDDLREAARKKGGVEWAGEAAPSSKELFPDVPQDLKHDHDHGHGHDHKTRRMRS